MVSGIVAAVNKFGAIPAVQTEELAIKASSVDHHVSVPRVLPSSPIVVDWPARATQSDLPGL